jgi:K+-transporting ATPase ATPase C chain
MIRQAIVIFLALTLLSGIVYPLAVTGVAQLVFPRQADGSMIEANGTLVGSSLIGQDFASTGDPKYFWGRPSMTSPAPYTSFDAKTLTGSSGSNLGPTNPALIENGRRASTALQARRRAERAYARARGSGDPDRSL